MAQPRRRPDRRAREAVEGEERGRSLAGAAQSAPRVNGRLPAPRAQVNSLRPHGAAVGGEYANATNRLDADRRLRRRRSFRRHRVNAGGSLVLLGARHDRRDRLGHIAQPRLRGANRAARMRGADAAERALLPDVLPLNPAARPRRRARAPACAPDKRLIAAASLGLRSSRPACRQKSRRRLRLFGERERRGERLAPAELQHQPGHDQAGGLKRQPRDVELRFVSLRKDVLPQRSTLCEPRGVPVATQ